MLDARTHAVRELRSGKISDAGAFLVNEISVAQPMAAVSGMSIPSAERIGQSEILEKWKHATPVHVAEMRIAGNPKMFEHRQQGKRTAAQVGEQTLRQIRWAAALLERSMNPDRGQGETRPFSTCTFQDLVLLDGWFDKLPVTCGKSPRDRDPTVSLQAICDRAIDRIDAGEISANALGRDGITTNKHTRKLKQITILCGRTSRLSPRSNLPSSWSPT